jgi:predicted DNA-binding ribbon-helix-helix protein
MKKHSVLVAGHATSITLENAFWQKLKAIAAHQITTLNRLITEIDQHRTGNLSSAIRVFVLEASREPPTKR